MEKANILFVSSVGGGSVKSVAEFLTCLPKDKYNLYLVLPASKYDVEIQEMKVACAGWEEMPIAYWNFPLGADFITTARIFFGRMFSVFIHVRTVYRLVRAMRKWDIGLVYTGSSYIIDGAIAARISRKKHVWHIRESIIDNPYSIFCLPEPVLVRVFDGMSDKILVVSEYVGAVFKKHDVDGKVEILHDGLMLDAFEDEKADYRLELNVGNGVVVGMVANMTSMVKKHDLFVNMASRLVKKFPGQKFVIFGRIPSGGTWPYDREYKYYLEIRRMVDDMGLQKNVIFAGYRCDVARIMNTIDILVHTCDIEGLSRVAVEAMAAGRPVVGVDGGGLSGLILDGVTGLLAEPDSVEGLAAATKRLILDAGLREKLGENGRKMVVKAYDIRKETSKLVKVFDELIQPS